MESSCRGTWAAAALAAALLPMAAHAATLDAEALERAPFLTTTGPSANYVVVPPSAYDAVGSLLIGKAGGTYGCSGSLLAGGLFVLTAAHCLADTAGNLDVQSLTATFYTDGNTVTGHGAAYYIAPGFNGTLEGGNDMGLIRLSSRAGIAGYDIWRTDTWLTPGAVLQVAGYGRPGTGAAGEAATGFGTLRAGENTYDGVKWTIPGSPYAWDFDDGTTAHDALGVLLGVVQTGLGSAEVMIAHGDSGGPTFYNGRLLAVHSGGETYGLSGGDIDAKLNSSFGELAVDTRTAAYANWIDSVTAPEPGSMALLAAGLAGVAAGLRRRRRA